MTNQTPNAASSWTSAQLLKLSQILGAAYGADQPDKAAADHQTGWTVEKLVKMSAAKVL